MSIEGLVGVEVIPRIRAAAAVLEAAVEGEIEVEDAIDAALKLLTWADQWQRDGEG